jgi:hypothetical protein
MKVQGHGPISPAGSRPHTSSIRDAFNFEAVFHIPSTHSLLVVRSRSRGGFEGGVYWEHEEYDPKGALIARYESFSESDHAGVRRSGWRKYDPTGRLIVEGEWH